MRVPAVARQDPRSCNVDCDTTVSAVARTNVTTSASRTRIKARQKSVEAAKRGHYSGRDPTPLIARSSTNQPPSMALQVLHAYKQAVESFLPALSNEPREPQ